MLLNMVDLGVGSIPESARKIALIAARPTVEAGIYQAGILARGFELVDLDWQAEIDHLLGATRTTTDVRVFANLWGELIAKAQLAEVDTLLVACLDLSAILTHAVTALQIVDVAGCLAREIIQQWLIRRPVLETKGYPHRAS